MQIKNFLISLFFAFFIALVIMLLCGCLSTPQRKDFTTEEAYSVALCMYYNQKNPDKSSCMPYILYHVDCMKDDRRRTNQK